MYAKYTGQAEGGDNARVAAFVFDLSDTDTSKMADLNKIKKPGDSQTYDFTITNSKSGKTNETTTTYTIELKTTGTMPLKAEVTENGTSICELDASDSTKNPQNKISGEITFLAGKSEEHKNQLKVTWPKEKADASYANGQAKGNIELIVKAQQQD